MVALEAIILMAQMALNRAVVVEQHTAAQLLAKAGMAR
jgi:hypothetical protein